MEDGLTFERTEDWPLVKKIVTHPKLWAANSDDLAPAPECWEPPLNPEIWYVLARHNGHPLGLFVFIPETRVCWQSHIAMLPEAWGHVARKACQLVFPWLWERTSCLRIVGSIPASNHMAVLFAIQCGMENYGVNPKSFLRNGILEDQVLLGINRPDKREGAA